MKSALYASLATSAVMLGAISFASPAEARDVQCGEPYRVVSGDTLSSIARDVYGSAGDFQIIYSANADRIGSNPGIIEIGLRLDIPCIGSVAPSTADTSVITLEATTQALPAPDKRQITFVTGTDWAPFTDESHEQGGMVIEIANVAMENADSKPNYKIDFVNDWGAHLRPLISDHHYDFSLVWFRPNCDLVERLGEGSQFRCNNLAWSEPVFEQLIGYYTREAEPAPQTHADLMGKTVCRPAAYATFMLEEHNLVEPNIKFVQPPSPLDCFTGLLDGTVDVAAISTDVAEGSILELNAGNEIRFNEGLSQVLTMHAVIAKTHPNADEYVDVFNNGLNKIKKSGEWFEIVKRHLTAHRAKTQS